jgi:hypothetical protein
MTTPSIQVERRAGQRFAFHLPVSVQELASGVSGSGFTQDVSSRGTFFFTDVHLTEGAEIELTLRMPSEITLGESMRVRCRCRVLRVTRPSEKAVAWISPPARSEAHWPAESETPVLVSAVSSEIQQETPPETPAETKIGVAVQIKSYEYLSRPDETAANFPRISSANSHPENRPAAQNLSGARDIVH